MGAGHINPKNEAHHMQALKEEPLPKVHINVHLSLTLLSVHGKLPHVCPLLMCFALGLVAIGQRIRPITITVH